MTSTALGRAAPSGVLLFPGTAFGERWVDRLRISYLQPQDVLEEAVERMAAVLERYA